MNHVPKRDFSLQISSDARATEECPCAKNFTYSLLCPLSPFSFHFTWFSSKREALTSSHQENQISPQLWVTFWWGWKRINVHISCVVMCWMCPHTSWNSCVWKQSQCSSPSLRKQRKAPLVVVWLGFFWGEDSNSICAGSIEKSTNFAKELHHVYHHRHFCTEANSGY